MRIYLAPLHIRPHAIRRMRDLDLNMNHVKSALYNPDSQYALDERLGEVMVKRMRNGPVVKVYFAWVMNTLDIRSVWVERPIAREEALSRVAA